MPQGVSLGCLGLRQKRPEGARENNPVSTPVRHHGLDVPRDFSPSPPQEERIGGKVLETSPVTKQIRSCRTSAFVVISPHSDGTQRNTQSTGS